MAKKKKRDLAKELKELSLDALEEGKKKAEKAIKELVEKGRISAEKGKKMIIQEKKKWEKKKKEDMLKNLKDLGVPTREEFDQLKKEVEKLKKKL